MNILKLFSIDSSPQHKRNCAVEGVRGVAILFVFLCHYADIVVPQLVVPSNWQNLARALSQTGRTGVALFFVLSGYLIYRTVTRRDFHLLRFWARRLQRIYPVFLAVLCIYLGIWVLHAGTDRSGEQLSARIPHDTAAALYYILQNVLFLPGIFPIKPLMNVAWSLSYEWFFYLMIPVGAIVLGRVSRARVRLSFVASFAILFLLVSYWSPAVSPALFRGCIQFVTSHHGLVLFLAGVIVYEVLQMNARMPKHLEWAAVAVILVALSVPFFIGRADHRAEVTIAASVFVGYGLLLYFSQCRSSHIERALSLTPLRCLGNISYSFYLIHGLPIHVTASFVARNSNWLARTPGASVAAMLVFLPLCLLFTTLISLALFVTIERPLSLRSESKSRPVVYSTVPTIPDRLAEDTLPA